MVRREYRAKKAQGMRRAEANEAPIMQPTEDKIKYTNDADLVDDIFDFLPSESPEVPPPGSKFAVKAQ